jgi:integrase
MPIVVKPLTADQLRKATLLAKQEERRVELPDGAVPGLRFRVTKDGRTSWSLSIRDRFGGWRRFPLVVQGTSLDAARKAAQATKERVQAGADPLEERRIERGLSKLAKAGDGTLDAVLRRYDREVGPSKRSWTLLDASIRRVFKRHLDVPYVGLTVASLQRTIDDHPGRQSCAHAVRAVRPVLKWAPKHVAGFPAGLHALDAPAANPPRQRVLSADEADALIRVFLDPQTGAHGAALLFMLLTAARAAEVCEMRWRDVAIDLGRETGTWTIPSNKSGVEHRVPLTRQAVWVVGEPGSDDDLVFHARNGTRLGNWDRTAKRISDKAGVHGWTRHDLRRTMATLCAQHGTAPHVVEALLGHVHVHTPLASVYNRVRYFDDIKLALYRVSGLVLRLPPRQTKDILEHGELEEPHTGPGSPATWWPDYQRAPELDHPEKHGPRAKGVVGSS